MTEVVNNGPVDGSTFQQTQLPANDDGSTGFINLSQVFETGLNFFGQTYNGLFVNNNGNVTLANRGEVNTGGPLGTFTPFGLTGATNLPIIAPFFADVDTRVAGSAVTTYGTGTYNGVQAFNVLWDGVGYFGSGQPGTVNVFQLVIAERNDVGSGDFDIYFNYNQIEWETGTASGGNSNGLGGTSAAAGYSAGSGAPGTFAQLQGSFQNGAFLDGGPNSLANGSNNGTPGQYLFQVRNGEVRENPGEEEPSAPAAPVSGVTLSVGGTAPMREGNEGTTAFTFTVSRSGDLTQGTTAEWTIDAGEGDLADGQALSGTIGFAAGQTSTTVTVLVNGDREFEADEMIGFALTSATHAGLTFDPGAGGIGIILNDDAPVLYNFAEPVMAPEGVMGATPFEFTVERIGDLTRASSVKWRLNLGETTAEDFAPGQVLEGQLDFAAGQRTGVITINVAGDIRAETDETFFLNLFEGVLNNTVTRFNVTTTGTIVDDDVRRTLLISDATTLVKTEGDAGATSFTFNLTRVGDLTRAGEATYTITLPAGGASAGEILTPLTGTVSFAAGQANATLTVQTAGDLAAEANEGFLIAVGGGDFNTLNLTAVIMNDDDATGASAPRGASPSAPAADSDVSSFMQNLVGGSIWGDAGI